MTACKCSDRWCAGHKGKASCDAESTGEMYRIDIIDKTGTPMCDACSEDAMDCGLFSSMPTHGGSRDRECMEWDRAASKLSSLPERAP